MISMANLNVDLENEMCLLLLLSLIRISYILYNYVLYYTVATEEFI